MPNNHESTKNNASEEKRAQLVYEYAKKRSQEIQKGLNKPAPVEASKKR